MIDPLSLSDAYNSAKDIYTIKANAVSANIDWYPSILNYLIIEKETNKQGETTAIELY